MLKHLKESIAMLTNKRSVFLVLLLALCTVSVAQVTISPTSLFIDSQRKFETLLIMNTSNTAQEVKLSFEFAYPKSDDEGNLAFIYDDAEQEALHSAADWIRGFPKNFILEAGARQVVRITAKAPAKLVPGVYWSRLKTTSSPVSPPVGATPDGGIAAQITFQFNQVTSIFYKYGQLSTALVMKDLRHQVNDDQLKIFANFSKSGNAPFLGSLQAKVFDATGALVKEGKVFVSIYYDGLRRLDLDIADLPMGTYQTEVSYATGRTDIPDADIIPAPTVTARGSFTKL